MRILPILRGFYVVQYALYAKMDFAAFLGVFWYGSICIPKR